MNNIHIKVRRLDPAATLPVYASEGAMCFDLHACLTDVGVGALIINPGESAIVPTGLAFELPAGWGLDVFARSGLARDGLSLGNGVGKIDPDYRGELGILLHNRRLETPFVIRHGDRIAQAAPVQIVRTTFEEFSQLSNTERGAGGFGSTGVAA